MPLITHVLLRDTTPEDYDKVRRACGWLDEHPVGGHCHLTYWDGNDCHNVDVWESEEAFGAFGMDRLGPAMAETGIEREPEVTFHLAHEVFLPAAMTVTETPI